MPRATLARLDEQLVEQRAEVRIGILPAGGEAGQEVV